ncbi:hypothetical protein GJ496_005993, partial [Pomphorhynchus laevis]
LQAHDYTHKKSFRIREPKLYNILVEFVRNRIYLSTVLNLLPS